MGKTGKKFDSTMVQDYTSLFYTPHFQRINIYSSDFKASLLSLLFEQQEKKIIIHFYIRIK